VRQSTDVDVIGIVELVGQAGGDASMQKNPFRLHTKKEALEQGRPIREEHVHMFRTRSHFFNFYYLWYRHTPI
jgi:hypothetical protein